MSVFVFQLFGFFHKYLLIFDFQEGLKQILARICNDSRQEIFAKQLFC